MGLSCFQVRWLLWHRVRSAYVILLEQIIHLDTDYSTSCRTFFLYYQDCNICITWSPNLGRVLQEHGKLEFGAADASESCGAQSRYTHNEVGCLPSPWSGFLGRSSPKIDGAISDIHVHVKLLQVPKHTCSSCFRLAQPRHERKHVLCVMSVIMHWSTLQTRNP